MEAFPVELAPTPTAIEFCESALAFGPTAVDSCPDAIVCAP